jgi:glycosyltransferase involved in cell wall biosynthesis
MSKISVIIPFRDERNMLLLSHTWTRELQLRSCEIIWVNDGSQDGSEKILAEIIGPEEKIIHTEGIGILGAFLEGSRRAQGDFFLWMPCDCNLFDFCFELLTKNKNFEGSVWGAFEKTYDVGKLSLYAFLQNKLLLPQGVAAWTNCFMISKEILNMIPSEMAFPQDLRLSKFLRAITRPVILPGKIMVSARKYSKDGKTERIFQNGLVLLLYFMKVEGKLLEGFYRRGNMNKFRIALLIFLLIFILSSLAVLASSTQRRPPPRMKVGSATQRPVPRKAVGSGTQKNVAPRSYNYAPIKRSSKEVEAWIFELPRSGVSIHSIEVNGNDIKIEGAYDDDASIKNFAKALTGDGKRDIKVKKRTYFKMGINKDYIIHLQNEW